MQSRWNDSEAQRFTDAARAAGQDPELGLRVYSSRIIGGDPDLVLHGGGNTSLKTVSADGQPIMHVKGSGWDLETIEAPGLPAVRMARLLDARAGHRLSDPAMVALLRASLLDEAAPNPSVEALLHAFLPYRFVDHTHATAVLALADQPDMRATVQEIYGKRLAFVPYVMPGFDLSVEGARIHDENPGCEGLWLENHGIFTFADTARGSYELMIEFVSMAEQHLARSGVTLAGPQTSDQEADPSLQALLHKALARSGSPFETSLALDFRSTSAIRELADHPHVQDIMGRGTVTPDHVIRLKPWPMIVAPTVSEDGLDDALDAYARRYRDYFERHASRADERKIMLDTYPRLIFVQGKGVFGLGKDAKAARIAGDLAEQASRTILAAEAFHRFTPIGEADLFDMEYWSLEQAKLAK